MEDRLETCKNCQWWWPNTQGIASEAHRESDLRECWGCENPALQCEIGSNKDLSGVETYDGLSTGPHFGCIHWRVKLPF